MSVVLEEGTSSGPDGRKTKGQERAGIRVNRAIDSQAEGLGKGGMGKVGENRQVCQMNY